MGLGVAFDIFGLGKCAYFGYNNTEKPWFGDIIGVKKWDAWTKYNGTPKTLCQKLFISKVQPLMVEYGFGYLLIDPKRPGPDYYSECKKFNWATTLIENHK